MPAPIVRRASIPAPLRAALLGAFLGIATFALSAWMWRAGATHAAAPGAPHRGVPVARRKRRVVQQQALDQVRERHWTVFGPGALVLQLLRRPPVVDRAGLLAEVASEGPGPHQGPELQRYGAAVLDGQ